MTLSARDCPAIVEVGGWGGVGGGVVWHQHDVGVRGNQWGCKEEGKGNGGAAGGGVVFEYGGGGGIEKRWGDRGERGRESVCEQVRWGDLGGCSGGVVWGWHSRLKPEGGDGDRDLKMVEEVMKVAVAVLGTDEEKVMETEDVRRELDVMMNDKVTVAVEL